LNTTEVCGQPVRTLFGSKPCVRGVLHLGGCNPFSNTAPKLDPKAAKNEVQQPTVQPGNDAVQNVFSLPPTQIGMEKETLPTPPTNADRTVAAGPVVGAGGRVGDPPPAKCVWQGTGGRCVREQGHYPATPHIEREPDAFS